MDTTADFWAEIDRAGRRRRARWGLGAVVAALAVGGTVACSSPADDADTASAQPAAPAAAPTSTPTPADPATPVTVDTGSSSQSGDPGTPPAPPAPAPTIDSFETPEDIDCHNGNFQEFTASWTTTNADRVTIAIDGSGIFAEYAADGETSLPFNCSSSHTFTLVAFGADGQTASHQITLEPRNVQPPADPIDDLAIPED